MSTQTASSAPPPTPVAQEGPGRAPALIAVLLAVLVVPMPISGTAVALPGIGASTHAALAPLQWVVNAFNVAFACFTLVWGSVADIIGRVRAFAAGVALYAAASLASAFATDVLWLDVTGRGPAGSGPSGWGI
ncbi:MFS transporter [Streptomyces sp. NPDC058240]|uniref:MFS transporter n=1 Tax=Streptomyces sp. NPDC058240 TaxID=3346396 RepID=UPI0036EFFD1D